MSTTSKSSMNNMKMIGAAVVVAIIVIAVGIVALAGGKSHAPGAVTSILPTTTIAAVANTTTVSQGTSNTTATTAPTTTVQSTSGATFQQWAGENLSLAQFSGEMDNLTFTKASMLNVTYNYKSAVSFSGAYTYAINSTGTTTIQKYYNNSRTDTTSSVSGESFASTTIYNATSHKQYICSNASGSYTCYVSSINESIVNSSGGLGFVGSEAGSNVTVSGYFNNIKVSSSSYNGQPCTLVTGNMYINAEAKNKSSGVVMQGTSSACVSTKYSTWLNQSLIGTMAITAHGNTTNANIDYSESETSIGTATTAAITALPGPIQS